MNARRSTAITFIAGLMLYVAAARGASQAAATAAAVTGEPQRLIGTVLSVERLPNRPGSKCGRHFDITVSVVGRAPQVLQVYDMGVPQHDLVALIGRHVEIDVVAGGIVETIRAAGRTAGRAAALSDLSTTKHC
jgi:hypothetical protein